MRFVVVTGMSGGGKSTALHMLEDVGFYCVDNLPVPLIEQFVEHPSVFDESQNGAGIGARRLCMIYVTLFFATFRPTHDMPPMLRPFARQTRLSPPSISCLAGRRSQGE